MGIAIAGILAVCVGVAAEALFGAVDAIAAGARIALTSQPPPRDSAGGMALTHVCFVPSDLIRGQQIALLAFLLGGVPAALVGSALDITTRRGRTHWRGSWSAFFHAAFVFQLCSAGLTSLAFLLAVPFVALDPAPMATARAAVFGVALACSIRGLRSWRALQMSVRDDPPRLT